MAKNVALSETAYTTISRLKRKDESYSDVVLRLAGEGKPPVSSFLGLWKGDEEIRKIYDKILKGRHKQKARWVGGNDPL